MTKKPQFCFFIVLFENEQEEEEVSPEHTVSARFDEFAGGVELEGFALDLHQTLQNQRLV